MIALTVSEQLLLMEHLIALKGFRRISIFEIVSHAANVTCLSY